MHLNSLDSTFAFLNFIMDQLSTRIKQLGESATLKMAKKSREMRGQGIDVISFSLGEPDFDTPEFIKDAAKKALDEGYTYYPPVAGYGELREAICKKLKRDNGLHFEPEQVVVSTGAKQTLANIVMSLIDPGDEVLIPAPFWVTYPEQVALAGGVVKTIETSVEVDYKFTAEQLDDALTQQTKLLIYSSPTNPSGSSFTLDELRAIAKVIEKYPQLIVVSDEMYEYISFDAKHESLAQFDAIKEQVVIVNGVSKGFAMTGWRLGYLAGPLWLAKACAKFQGQITSGTNSIAQRAMIAAMEAGPASVQNFVDTFKNRRDLILKLLGQMPGVKTNTPTGAFYVLPDISSFFGKKTPDGDVIGNSEDLAMYILQEGEVAMVAGAPFGVPSCIRISYANSEDQIKTGMERMRVTLAKLQ